MSEPRIKWLSALPRPHADEIRDLRGERTQAEMAQLAGLSNGTRWHEYEAGVRKPHWAVWELLLLREGLHPTLKLAPKGKPAKK